MDDCERIESLSDAALHLSQFVDLMKNLLPKGWGVCGVRFDEMQTKHGFQIDLVGETDALDTLAMLETVITLAEEIGGKTNAIH